MGDLLPVVAAVYLLVGAGAGVWSHRHGSHRPEASSLARVISATIVAHTWPAMAFDLWLADPETSRRERPERKGPG